MSLLQRCSRVSIREREAWINGTGTAAPLSFIGLYALATLLFLPGAVLTLAGGKLFGPLWGTLYNLLGATLGATMAFLIARHLAGDWVRTRAKGLIARLMQGVEAEGWRFVAFTRLVPLFPFNLLNYALAWPVWLEAMAGSEGLIRNGFSNSKFGCFMWYGSGFQPLHDALRWRVY
ncbi:SNARE associated Golgi protein [Thiorhodovibrio winogradskyi]|uniref:TVP38/TMEM64 family membrane protein n=1 Tax=Thiorhodovibrio winogradskyi TaxID=77007 RepID=A0ABZ0S6J6_9GAMM